jgi:hypothetical protein
MEFEFVYSHQPNMDAGHYLELEGADHNDVLYADIRRQVLPLTADDDEDLH